MFPTQLTNSQFIRRQFSFSEKTKPTNTQPPFAVTSDKTLTWESSYLKLNIADYIILFICVPCKATVTWIFSVIHYLFCCSNPFFLIVSACLIWSQFKDNELLNLYYDINTYNFLTVTCATQHLILLDYNYIYWIYILLTLTAHSTRTVLF